MLISLPYLTVVALNQFIYRRVKCTSRCLKISVNHVSFLRIPLNCKTYYCPPFRPVFRSNVFWSRPMIADLVNVRWDGPCRWILLVVGAAYYTVAELGKMKKVYLKTTNQKQNNSLK